MSTADKVCTVILGALALATIALILLQLAAEDTVITVRPLTLPDAITTPAAGVPVSPALHHIADGRVPGPVTGRVAASVLPRHAAPRPAHARTPGHAQPRTIFTRSTL